MEKLKRIINKSLVNRKLTKTSVLILSFVALSIIFLIWSINILHTVRYAKIVEAVGINIKGLDEKKLDRVKVYRVAPKSGIYELKRKKKNYYADTGYYKSIVIAALNSDLNKIEEIEILIGEKRFNFSRNDIYKKWIKTKFSGEGYDVRNILYFESPSDIFYLKSKIEKFNNIINWSGDFTVLFITFLFAIIFVVLSTLFLFFIFYFLKLWTENIEKFKKLLMVFCLFIGIALIIFAFLALLNNNFDAFVIKIISFFTHKSPELLFEGIEFSKIWIDRLFYISKICLFLGIQFLCVSAFINPSFFKIEKNKKLYFVIYIVVTFLFLYSFGAVMHLNRVNTDRTLGDQSAYINAAKSMYKSKYDFRTGRNRMPAFAFIQSLFYHDGLSDEEFFVQGKYVNIIISIFALLIIFLILQKYFNEKNALALFLIISFTVFMFKAAYFQCEILYYFLNFCCFLLIWNMLKNPTWKLGIITGGVLGITHLTKASVLPGLLLFMLIAIIRSIYIFIKEIDKKSKKIDLKNDKKKFILELISIFIVILLFSGVIYPYIKTSKEVFGRYFYNVNSTFYMWTDTWEEATMLTRSHGDRSGWPDLPDELIPGASKYLREHTIDQIVMRILRGFRYIHIACLHSYGYYKYFLIFFVFFIYLICANFNQIWKIGLKNIHLGSFCILYFFGYLTLFAFYAQLSRGQNRFQLGLFMPIMFCFSYVIYALPLKNKSVSIYNYKLDLVKVFHVFIFVILTFDLWDILLNRISTVWRYAGS